MAKPDIAELARLTKEAKDSTRSVLDLNKSVERLNNHLSISTDLYLND